MKINESVFFKEATLRICGSLDIGKALWDCFLFIRRYIPADHILLDTYDYNTKTLKNIAHAVKEKWDTLLYQEQLSYEAHKQILEEWVNGERVRIIKRLRDNVATELTAEKRNVADCSSIMMDIILEGEEIGMLSVIKSADKPVTYSKEHVRLLKLLNQPIAIALSNSLKHFPIADR